MKKKKNRFMVMLKKSHIIIMIYEHKVTPYLYMQ